MNSAEIREAFLAYFESKGHTRVPSSSLVPNNDPTLLFTNAGMVQFKDTFLGSDPRPYTRATTSQRCVRAGGKHNDLDNVGYTARHHTFFEMLGNFSFGDYFKRDAIKFAWEFLTEVLKLPEDKLWVTVHISDQEAEDIWLKEMGVSAERFSRLDEDNFWSMGDTGPCGPSSEIFYDHGADVWGGPPGSPEEDGDRYIEIWNLVFMQFNRSADGTQTALPNPSIDTGMGLERIAAVMQHVHSNYEIDLFQSLLKAAAKEIGTDDLSQASLKVVADHIRSCAFMVVDGVVPSNEGRGYVLRRIIRRAIRHGNKLGAQGEFFNKLVAPLVGEMGEAYPELAKQAEHVAQVLQAEEQQFAKTLDQGMRILEADLAELKGSVISGETAFKLYDTYGFPVDLTADIARERELTVDMEGFEACMQQQRERARAAGAFDVDYNQAIDVAGETEFTGYGKTSDNAEIIALYKEGAAVETLSAGEEGIVLLNASPFYAESGGQVGDTGAITVGDARFDVADTQKQKTHFVHAGSVAAGSLKVGDTVDCAVDADKRQATALNHSATHLLHAALRDVLGDHVAQKGSLCDDQRLRFDFAHPQAVTAEELAKVQAMVNAEIRRNTSINTELMSIDAAMESGAMALFGEKYDDEVRVLSMGEGFSVELCGGTHATRTGDIGLLHITAESGVAAGVRRIEAVTGERALAMLQGAEQSLLDIARSLKADRNAVADKLTALLGQQKAMEKEIAQLKQKLASGAGSDMMDAVQDVNGVSVLVQEIEGGDAKMLRDLLDQLKNKIGSGIVVLAAVNDGKIALIAGVSKDLTGTYSAGNIIKALAPMLGGKGGGRPDMAQGGGTDVNALPKALQEVPSIVKSMQ
jgi:alanyl-tRNA synthetase